MVRRRDVVGRSESQGLESKSLRTITLPIPGPRISAS